MQSSANNYKNGLFERPIEHFSGSATIVSGNDLRRINPLNFTEALKYYDPSFIVTRDNLNGDDPNVTPSVKIRARIIFLLQLLLQVNQELLLPVPRSILRLVIMSPAILPIPINLLFY